MASPRRVAHGTGSQSALSVPKGRGAGANPGNRFESLHYAKDLDAAQDGAGPDPRTQYIRDPSRSIVATNTSPDVGFDASVNPYRGCEHGCVYCLGPDTPVLHADLRWRPLGDVQVGDNLVAFDEVNEPGRTRKLRKAVVQAVWWSRKPTLRMTTRHSEVTTTTDHRWLQPRSFRWPRTNQLSKGKLLRHMPVLPTEGEDDDYRAGYIAGLSIGDGTFRYEPGWRSDKLGYPAAYWRIALIDREPLRVVARFLRRFGVEVALRPFDAGRTTTPMWKVETRSLPKLAVLHSLLNAERSSRSYRRGFLAGFFDAEGHNGNSLRIAQKDLGMLGRVQSYALSLGFDFQQEIREGHASTMRLRGSTLDRLRFFSVIEPRLRRKVERLFGKMPVLDPEPVEHIEAGPVQDVVDIQTSTGTFYAAGLATHNCYARPFHEYLGFSAGLDFETKILVKPDAPALLRKKLASKSWKPQVLALSGVTDPYQPVERKLEITRRLLEVLLEFRNPVAIITKNALVTRDLDLLAELASLDCAAVSLSVTTLDPKLQQVMEPRTSPPHRRLEAIERLAGAGVPTGVMVAPVIPGLTDHEVPAIVEAAARAGATRAGTVVLRLPHAVKGLMEDWLESHFPERREKVLNRLRSLHGEELYRGRFRLRQRGEGFFATQMQQIFDAACRRHGIAPRDGKLSTAHFRRPGAEQLGLFEGG